MIGSAYTGIYRTGDGRRSCAFVAHKFAEQEEINGCKC